MYTRLETHQLILVYPVGKIAEKAVCRSGFLGIWHCILSAELTKTHFFQFCPLGIFKSRFGRPVSAYIDQLCRDGSCLPEDLPLICKSEMSVVIDKMSIF